MKTYLVALSLLTLAFAAAPTASAWQAYCGENVNMCCAAEDDAVGDAVIRGCMVLDHTVGATYDVVDVAQRLADCILNGNC